MGRISRSWELVKLSFAILKSDKELMLLPIASAISCVLVSVVILAGGAVAFWPLLNRFADNPGSQLSQPLFLAAVFVFYLANYFVIVFFNVALVSAAFSRLAGGTATCRDGIRQAWQRKGRILEWALLAATVGLLLHMLEERVGWLGRIIVKMIGLAWTLASFFVAPVLAFEDLGPVGALKRSAHLFRNTWGEEVVGGISISVIFLLLALPGVALWAGCLAIGGINGMAVGIGLMVLYFLLLAVVSAAVRGIYVAALYRYASTGQVAPGFKRENFSMAWQRKTT
jgi:hypothetical protein